MYGVESDRLRFWRTTRNLLLQPQDVDKFQERDVTGVDASARPSRTCDCRGKATPHNRIRALRPWCAPEASPCSRTSLDPYFLRSLLLPRVSCVRILPFQFLRSTPARSRCLFIINIFFLIQRLIVDICFHQFIWHFSVLRR